MIAWLCDRLTLPGEKKSPRVWSESCLIITPHRKVFYISVILSCCCPFIDAALFFVFLLFIYLLFFARVKHRCQAKTNKQKNTLRQKAELRLNCQGTKRVYNSIWCLCLILWRKSPADSGENLAQIWPTFGPDQPGLAPDPFQWGSVWEREAFRAGLAGLHLSLLSSYVFISPRTAR